jgi:uncharacterized protein YceK
MKRINIIVLVLMMSLVSGCMSISSRSLRDRWSIPRYYPGVCFDAYFIATPFVRHNDLSFHEGIGFKPKISFLEGMGFMLQGVVDLPFSMIYDTILLPMDIWVYDEGSHPRETQIKQEFKDGHLRKQEDKSNQPSDRTR